MAKYKIDVYDIRRKLQECQAMYEKDDISNIADKNLDVIEMIDNYKFLLANYDLKRQVGVADSTVEDSNNSDDTVCDDEIIDEYFLSGINFSNREIDGIMIDFYRTFQTLENDEALPINPLCLDNDELLELTDKIIKSTDNKNFISYYEKAKKLIHTHIQYYNDYYPVTGVCLFDKRTLESFRFIIRENSMMDVITSVHETFHSIIYYYIGAICNSSYACKSEYVNEVDGYLANLITSDYIESISPYHLSRNLINIDIQDAVIQGRKMAIGSVAIDHLDNNGNIIIDGTNNELLSDGIFYKWITQENKYDYIYESYVDLSARNCAFLTACDLFDIYKQDKEKAIYNLLKISEASPDNLVKTLQKHGITFMNDGFNSFKKINKALEKKKY